MKHYSATEKRSAVRCSSALLGAASLKRVRVEWTGGLAACSSALLGAASLKQCLIADRFYTLLCSSSALLGAASLKLCAKFHHWHREKKFFRPIGGGIIEAGDVSAAAIAAAAGSSALLGAASLKPRRRCRRARRHPCSSALLGAASLKLATFPPPP